MRRGSGRIPAPVWFAECAIEDRGYKCWFDGEHAQGLPA